MDTHQVWRTPNQVVQTAIDVDSILKIFRQVGVPQSVLADVGLQARLRHNVQGQLVKALGMMGLALADGINDDSSLKVCGLQSKVYDVNAEAGSSAFTQLIGNRSKEVAAGAKRRRTSAHATNDILHEQAVNFFPGIDTVHTYSPQVHIMGRIWKAGMIETRRFGCTMRLCSDVPGVSGLTKSIEWVKPTRGSAPWQWCGWKEHAIERQWLRVSFWIKFVAFVPEVIKKNFGLKIHGAHYQNWVKEITCADKWVWVSVVAHPRPGGDRNYILLIFDAVDKPQTIRFAGLELEVFNTKPSKREEPRGT